MANIRVTCPTCNETLELDEQYVGQEVECGACYQTFVAKAPSSRRRARDEDDEERPVRRKSRRDDYDDDEDDDYAPPRRRRRRRYYGSEGPNQAASRALWTGILSIVFAFCCLFVSVPLGITAIASGVSGMKQEEGRGAAMAGLICGAIGLILSVISFIIALQMNMNGQGPFGPRPGRGR